MIVTQGNFLGLSPGYFPGDYPGERPKNPPRSRHVRTPRKHEMTILMHMQLSRLV